MKKNEAKVGSRVKLIESNIVSNIGQVGTVVIKKDRDGVGVKHVYMDEPIWVRDEDSDWVQDRRIVLTKERLVIYEPEKHAVLDENEDVCGPYGLDEV